MSFSIATGFVNVSQGGGAYIALTIFSPNAEEEGAAAGAVYAAAEAALKIDPYGLACWSYNAESPKAVHHQLLFKASCDDVLAGGPIHTARQLACKNAMYSHLRLLLKGHG